MPRLSITIPGDEPQPYSVTLDNKLLRIGRSEDNELVIEHNSISSQHCELKRVSGGFLLADSDSTNGIHLDGAAMDVIDLIHGSQVQIGDAILTYELSEEETAALSAEPFKARQRKKKPKKTAPPASASPAASYRRPQMASAKKNNGAVDFVIFLLFAGISVGAFWFGLSHAHIDATRSEESPNGRSLSADIAAAKAEENAAANETE